MKILVIAAHPDDEVYGMGGTMAKLAAQGHEIHVLIVTDGCTSQYRNDSKLTEILLRKRKEAQGANALLGTTLVHFGEFPDMKLDIIPHIEVNALIENSIDEIKPEVVYTHFYGDVNLDHQMVYRSALVAVRPTPGQSVKRLFCYRVPSATEWSPQLSKTTFMPNVMVDISNTCEQKRQAIAAYQTEIRTYPHPRSAQYVSESDRACGLQWGIGSAEAFMLLRGIY
ncbi:MAG: PIG-L deacetylase family protein [Lachnospiraceae bacterium]